MLACTRPCCRVCRPAPERAVADAHPNGKHPWTWPEYAGKFTTLADSALGVAGQQAFLAAAKGFSSLPAGCIDALLPALPAGLVVPSRPTGQGIFDRGME